MNVHDPIIGIDLGTSNSAVAFADDGGARMLVDAQGHAIQPTVVSFHPNGSVIVGAGAKQRRVLDPRNTIYSAKRLIGRTFDAREVSAVAARVPFTIKQGVNHQPVVVTRAGEFAIPELSAIVLDHLRGLAQGALGQPIAHAVVAVPANFTDAQRSATVTAGDIAGLEVVQVINEPTAAALAYGHRRKLNQRVAVYDFGGGTFDITLLEVRGTVYEVLATAGDPYLGGDDVDERLVETMVRLFQEQQGVDLSHDLSAMQRLRTVAEQIKIELSRRSRARVTIDQLAQGPGGGTLDFSMRVTRDDLEAHAAELVDRSFAVCSEAMRMAGLRPGEIGDVILVGGTTKMPLVRRRVGELFGCTPRTDLHPDEAVALGAAIHGRALRGTLVRDPRQSRRRNTATGMAPPAPPMAAQPAMSVQPPIDEDSGSPWPRGGTVPWISFAEDMEAGEGRRRLDTLDTPTLERELEGDFQRTDEQPTLARAARVDFGDEAGTGNIETGDIEAILPALPEPDGPSFASSQADDEDDTGIQLPDARFSAAADSLGTPEPLDIPDDVEVAGAADWPAAPDEPPIILEVTPHGLGVATVAGYCRLLIARNSRVPAEAHQVFTTSKNMQQTVRIRVCQGESKRLDENMALGDLVLEGIEPRPRGQTRIEVSFGIDESGILQVRARDLETGLEQRGELHIEGAPSQEEITAAGERLRQLRR